MSNFLKKIIREQYEKLADKNLSIEERDKIYLAIKGFQEDLERFTNTGKENENTIVFMQPKYEKNKRKEIEEQFAWDSYQAEKADIERDFFNGNIDSSKYISRKKELMSRFKTSSFIYTEENVDPKEEFDRDEYAAKRADIKRDFLTGEINSTEYVRRKRELNDNY